MFIIVPKPSLVRVLHAPLRARYPSQSLTYLCANPFGWPFVFDYPAKLSWNQYPFWTSAQYALAPSSQHRVRVEEDGHLVRDTVDYRELSPQAVLEVPDACRSGITASRRLKTHLLDLGKITHSHGVCALSSLTDLDIARALDNPMAEAEVQKAYAEGQLRADFDFNFLVNAAGLLTRCYQSVGGDCPNPVFSKYTIQTLYAVRSAPSPTVDGMLRHMYEWKGTGKHRNPSVQLGSVTSRLHLIENLTHLGLLAQVDDRLQLTPRGDAFLNTLHPDCEDVDLPFRLEQWTTELGAGRAAAQRYIRTWFGKQKRFMDR